jgi:hypothetical protein
LAEALAIEAASGGIVPPREEFWSTPGNPVLTQLLLKPADSLAPHLRMAVGTCAELATLADIVRTLQDHPQPSGIEPVLARLRADSAAAVDRLGASLRSPRDVRALQARAALLNGSRSATEELCHELYGDASEELFVFCGDLETWPSRSRRAYHSLLIGVPDPTRRRLTDRFRQLALRVLDELQERLGLADYRLDPWPRLDVLDLVVCAGEADRYPKHFAYFLPENDPAFSALDRGAAGFPGCTVVLYNVLDHQSRHCAQPRLARFVTGLPDGCLDTRRRSDWVLMWMAGHDLGHFVRARREAPASSLPAFVRGVAAEARADAYGLAIACSQEVLALVGADEADVLAIFLGEMLRYLSRPVDRFEDSSAALLELSYLLEAQAIRVQKGRRLTVDPPALREAIDRLCHDLFVLSLEPGGDRLGRFVDHHLHGSASARAAAAFVDRLQDESQDLPMLLAYPTHWGVTAPT